MKDRGNLRPAPAWITPDLVRRVVELFEQAPGAPAPVALHPTPRVGPNLKLVVDRDSVEQPKRRTFHALMGEKAARFEANQAERLATRQRRRAREAAREQAALDRAKAKADRLEAARIARDAAAAGRARVNAERVEAARIARDQARLEPKPRQWFEEPQFLQAVRIAHRRGISGADLARAIGRQQPAVMAQAKRLGFAFGHRPPFANPPTLEQLLAFDDDSVPLPELRRDRTKLVRLEREGKAKRDKREKARADDPNYRPRTDSYAPRSVRQVEHAKRIAERAQPPLQLRPASATVPARVEAAPVPARPHPIAPKAGLPIGAAAYAEAINAAKAYLEARHCTVRKVDRDALIARWTVTGFYGSFDNAELVELAARMGMAQVA